MKRKCKQLTALILALAMCVSLLSTTAWAAETDEEEAPTEIVTTDTEDAGEAADVAVTAQATPVVPAETI